MRTLQNRKHRIYTIGKAPNKEKINEEEKNMNILHMKSIQMIIERENVENPGKNNSCQIGNVLFLHLSVFFGHLFCLLFMNCLS